MVELFAQHYAGHHGHIGKGKNKGPYQCKSDCLCHGLEHFTLDAGEAEDRDINDQDDDLSKYGCSHHPSGGLFNGMVHLALAQLQTHVLVGMQPMEHCLHNDHCTIYNQSKIKGSQAHQVTRHTKKIHHAYSKQHGQRNHGSHNEAGPQVSQEKNQDQEHYHCPFQQIGFYSSQGAVDHFGAIQKSIDFNPLWQGLFNLFHAFLNMPYHIRSIFSFQHQDHCTRDLTFIHIGKGTIPNRTSNSCLCNIPDINGCAGSRFCHIDILDLFNGFDQAF